MSCCLVAFAICLGFGETAQAPTAAPCHRLDKGTSGIVAEGSEKVTWNSASAMERIAKDQSCLKNGFDSGLIT